MLGLGYPGGPALQRLADDGDPRAFDFPTARQVAGLDFSFSGLKTALLYKLRELGEEESARRFPPVVRFFGPFELKAGEKKTHEVPLSAYVGALRVMVVAGRGGAYGRAEKTVPVRQPRHLPNDRFGEARGFLGCARTRHLWCARTAGVLFFFTGVFVGGLAAAAFGAAGFGAGATTSASALSTGLKSP